MVARGPSSGQTRAPEGGSAGVRDMGAMIALPGGPGNRVTGAEAALALDLQGRGRSPSAHAQMIEPPYGSSRRSCETSVRRSTRACATNIRSNGSR